MKELIDKIERIKNKLNNKRQESVVISWNIEVWEELIKEWYKKEWQRYSK